MRNIYTRKGDTGTTSLCGGVLVDKDDQAIEICGTIDELSASLGVVRTEELSPQFETILLRIQRELIAFCTEIATNSVTITSEHVRQLESDIDRIASELPPLTQFIIPGKNRTSAMLHLSRTICRRAERCLVTLYHTEICRTENPSLHLIAYLNRLSDLLFVLARKVGEQ